MSQQETAERSDEVQEAVATDSSLVDELSWEPGAILGAGAFIVGYVLFYHLTNVLSTYQGGSEEGVSTWVAAGWTYLAALNVGLEANSAEAALSQIPQVGAPISVITLLIPPITLIAAGYLLVSYVDPEEPVEVVKTSLLLVPPFLVLSLVSAFLMSHSFTADAPVDSLAATVEGISTENTPNTIDVSPALSDAVLYAGILYPALFGIVGGAIARWQQFTDELVAQFQ
jgi:hypothetical protein